LTLWQRIHSFGTLSGARRLSGERFFFGKHREVIPMAVGKVSDADFDSEVLKATGAVVVDFWAEWCGPCRMIAPALEEISGSLNGKVKIVKLNVDENPQTASKYGVMSIPTLMLFKNGEMASRQVGAAPKQKLEQWITGAM
jgi:thioredoxin 1